MELIVLAGGFGTRLIPALKNTPKALAPVAGRPFLAYQIENWRSQGVRSFIFLLHHQHEEINSFLSGARNYILQGCSVRYLVEGCPLDTGGAVANAVQRLSLKGEICVINADTWLSNGLCTLSCTSGPAVAVLWAEDSGRYGRIQFDEASFVTEFTEKESPGGPGWINAGLCRLPSCVFDKWDGARLSLEREIFPKLVRRGELRAVAIESDFIDIGVPDDYWRFCRWIEADRKGKLWT